MCGNIFDRFSAVILQCALAEQRRKGARLKELFTDVATVCLEMKATFKL